MEEISTEDYKKKYLECLEEQLRLYRRIKHQEQDIENLKEIINTKDKEISFLSSISKERYHSPSPPRELPSGTHLLTIAPHTPETMSIPFIPEKYKADSTKRPAVNINESISKKKKYDMLANGTTYERQCDDCAATHTSGHWCQDVYVQGGHICQKCYRRRRRAKLSTGRDLVPVHICENCSTNETKTIWFKHPKVIGRYLCDTCNEKIKITCEVMTQNTLISPAPTATSPTNSEFSEVLTKAEPVKRRSNLYDLLS